MFCYGLAFGMGLVLLVVPALMAMQLDAARWMRAARRAASRRAGLAAVATWAGMGGIAALFAVTLGAVIVTGALPAFLPPLPVEGAAGALALFLAATAVLLIAIWLLVSAVHLARRRRPAPT